MRKKTALRAAALAVTLSAAPLAFSPADGVTASSACAQKMGTWACCFQPDALCVSPTGIRTDAYFNGEGRCS
jgi:hypothetical protein